MKCNSLDVVVFGTFDRVLAVVVLISACKQLGITKTLYEDYPTVALGCIQSKKPFTVQDKLSY